jgi:hypothetical protein
MENYLMKKEKKTQISHGKVFCTSKDKKSEDKAPIMHKKRNGQLLDEKEKESNISSESF